MPASLDFVRQLSSLTPVAGWFTTGVTWGSHSKESLEESFDTVVGSVAELRAVLMQAVNFSAVRPAVQVEPMQVEE